MRERGSCRARELHRPLFRYPPRRFAHRTRTREARGAPGRGVHICIVSPYDPRPDARDDPLALRGGVEESLDRCARGLAARGHKVTVVASAARGGESVEPDGVRLVRVKRYGALFRAPLAPLASHVPDEADVVHVPATYPGVSDLIPWQRARRGRATVLDYHFDVHGTSLPMRAASAVHRRTLGRGMVRASRIVCKSLDYARVSPVLSGIPADRLDEVPNGVAVDEFALDAPKTTDILCVGRLVPYKGVHVLIEAMGRVHRETGARLVVAGDGPERDRLRSLAAQRGAPVSFLGRVPQADLPGLYASARVTVLPSVNSQEAFGIALLESMAAGTPVVASDLPGVREVASLAGLTAPAGDAEALADAIIAAWEDPGRFGHPQDIRRRVRSRYDWARVVERLEAVYESAQSVRA